MLLFSKKKTFLLPTTLCLDAFGLRIVHGEIPGSFGRYGCVISHIFAGSFIVASDIHEGDEVIEINGIPMSEKSDEEITDHTNPCGLPRQSDCNCSRGQWPYAKP